MLAFQDRVTVERELKSNTRGAVLLVREKGTDRRLVCRECIAGPEVFRKLQDIDCPHLPRVWEIAERDGVTAVLEEYVQGDTLSFLLRNGPLPQEQAVKIASQLCLALEALHAAGIVHRDIKPENILLRGGDAMLIDFDISRLYKPGHTTDTQVMGTTGYAAPEQFGFTQTDARADIYSLGVVLNEMLTGRHPSTLLAPGRPGKIVRKCVEVNLARRYASARDVRMALESIGRPRWRTPLPQIMAASAAVIFLAALVLLRGGTSRRRRLSVSGELPPGEYYSRMYFSYDLDGDGAPERYLFGVAMDLPGNLPGGVDGRALWDNTEEAILAAPCVWREYDDGTLERADEMAALLEEPRTELCLVERAGTEDPAVYTAPALDKVWDGAIEVVYTGRCAGLWRYVAAASLDGLSLTATASTSLERMADRPAG